MFMIIKGKKIILRQLKKTDDKALFKYANDRLVSRYTTVPFPYTLAIAQSFIKDTAKKIKAGTSYDLGIVAEGGDEVIGMAAIRIIEGNAKVGEIGYWLGRKHWGKGIVSEAAAMMLKFAFKDLKLNKVHAKVMSPNSASVKILGKNNFMLEGNLRKQDCKIGKIYDVLVFGLLKEEYKKK
jgi:RimJ/RimL family protein N-acetyltransferase